jgi:DNA-directed RNA polymerase subunit RPC12/RpoP
MKAHKIGDSLSSTAALKYLLVSWLGSLLFCPDCGTLLDLPGEEEYVECEQCGHREPVSCKCATSIFWVNYRKYGWCVAYENTVVTTRSHPDAFPSALKLKRTTQTKIHEGADLGTKVTAHENASSGELN